MSIRPAPELISAKQFTYEEAIGILFHDARFDGRAPRSYDSEGRLDRMRAVLAELDNPQRRFRTIHVTGTKGKGSTSAYTESILRHLGHRTGLFTSPHLHTFRERIRVDGQLIGREACVELIERALPQLEATPDLTVFGRITILAFLYFARAGVDWAVVEVGVGGRLDSTNVLLPAVCGITHISKDHMHILGDSLEEIAAEKAGIIKSGTPVFSAPQKQKTKEVLRRVAEEKEAPLTEVPFYRRAALPLVGQHQQINAGIAFGMVQDLHRRGLTHWDDQLVDRGLAHTRWPCRIEWLPQPEETQSRRQDSRTGDIPLVVDCAHNRDSLEILLSTLAETHPRRPFTFVFGVSRDKDIAPMLTHAIAASPRLVLVQSRHPKAMSAADLRAAIAALPENTDDQAVISAPSMKAALETATRITPPGGYLVGTGSVFVAAELREAWNELHSGLFPPDDWIHQANTDPPLAPLPPGYGAI